MAPSGLRGVHSLPKAAHSCGLIRPCSTSPERHSVDSPVWPKLAVNRREEAAFAAVNPACEPSSKSVAHRS